MEYLKSVRTLGLDRYEILDWCHLNDFRAESEKREMQQGDFFSLLLVLNDTNVGYELIIRRHQGIT